MWGTGRGREKGADAFPALERGVQACKDAVICLGSYEMHSASPPGYPVSPPSHPASPPGHPASPAPLPMRAASCRAGQHRGARGSGCSPRSSSHCWVFLRQENECVRKDSFRGTKEYEEGGGERSLDRLPLSSMPQGKK